MGRMEADLWTLISTFASSGVNPAFPTAAIVPFNFSHYPLCSQTNKLINLLIVQTFQLHSSRIYDCLVNGWWVLCRKHHPNGTTVNTREGKQTDMVDTFFFFLHSILHYSDWNKRIKWINWGKKMVNYHKNGCLCDSLRHQGGAFIEAPRDVRVSALLIYTRVKWWTMIEPPRKRYCSGQYNHIWAS